MGSQAGDSGVDVVDGEHDVARPSVFAATSSGSGLTAAGADELRQLEPAVGLRGAHHRDVDPYAVETVDTVHPGSLDQRRALQLHTEFDEERDGSLKVVDDDADVVHPLDRHAPIIRIQAGEIVVGDWDD